MNNRFVAFGYNGTILVSSNAINWMGCASGTANELRAAAASSNLVVLVGPSGTVVTSGDGLHWTNQTSVSYSPYFGDVAYGNGNFVALDEAYTGVHTSSNGVDWVSRPTGSANALYSIAFGSGTFVAVGVYGTILTSRNLINWAPRSPAPQSATLYDVRYYLGRFVAVGSGGILISSTNAVDWTLHRPLPIWMPLHIYYGAGSFMLTGYGNSVLESDRVAELDLGRSSGLPEVRVSGLESCTYRIESTDELRPSSTWMPRVTMTLTNSPASWLDMEATNHLRRFYRVVLLP